MEHELYLQKMHGNVSKEGYPYKFDQKVMAALPQAREALKDHELLKDPLESIRASVPMIQVFAEHAPDMAFSTVCNILILIEEADRQGFSENQILDALLGGEEE